MNGAIEAYRSFKVEGSFVLALFDCSTYVDRNKARPAILWKHGIGAKQEYNSRFFLAYNFIAKALISHSFFYTI